MRSCRTWTAARPGRACASLSLSIAALLGAGQPTAAQTGGSACAPAAAPAAAPAPQELTLEAQVAGTWQENFDRSEVCHNAMPSFRLVLDRARKTLTFQYDRDVQAYDGQMRRTLVYFIREYRPRSLVLALDGETRKADSGNPVEWELIFVGQGIYRWRATEWPHREVNRIIGVRCAP